MLEISPDQSLDKSPDQDVTKTNPWYLENLDDAVPMDDEGQDAASPYGEGSTSRDGNTNCRPPIADADCRPPIADADCRPPIADTDRRPMYYRRRNI